MWNHFRKKIVQSTPSKKSKKVLLQKIFSFVFTEDIEIRTNHLCYQPILSAISAGNFALIFPQIELILKADFAEIFGFDTVGLHSAQPPVMVSL